MVIYIGDELQSENEKPKKLEVQLEGEQISIDYDGELPILEALLDAGFNPPYSCMNGNCMACMAKVESGRVAQEEMGILTDDNVEDREALTCQAKGLSEVTKINYDL